MTSRSMVTVFALLVVALVLSSTLYVVPETHRAVKLRFGEMVEFDVQPGLHVKLPMVERIKQFDVRVLTLDMPSHSYLTIEKKPLEVDSFVVWRIKDVAAFYRATQGGDEMQAASLLASRVDNGLRDQFGVRTMHEVVSGQRDALMHELITSLGQITEKEFGIEVVDIRVKQIDLPREVSENVYRRMSAERDKEAQGFRSRGRELAEGIRADADRQKVIVEAEAFSKAERLRGEGEEVAAQIYADAYNRNAEFYSFYRSLSAYDKAFANKSDLMVLDAKSDFLKYLTESTRK